MDEKIKQFKRAIFSKTGYTPHFAQEAIHFHDWGVFTCSWGRRSGKTIAAAQEAIAELAIPNRRVWVVAPNYPLSEKVFREVWQAIVIDGALGPPSEVVSSKRFDARGGSMFIRLAWGSWIEGKTAENPTSLVGEGLDLLIIDEAAKVHALVWEKYLEPTLVDRKGRCLMITTPEGRNWFYGVYQRGTVPETREKGWRCSQMKSESNPYLDKEWIDRKRTEVTPEIFRQEYEASFEHHTGLVWPEFVNHLIPNGHIFNDSHMAISSRMSHYRSIDPGLKNPTACIWAAVDHDNNVWVYQDYEVADVLADIHAANIKVKTAHKIVQTYIDPSATRSNATDGLSVADVFRENGIYAIPAPNDLASGIQIVARYLRATLDSSAAHPKLFIHENCGSLRTAIDQYIWDEYASLTDKNAPDRPRKRNDHPADALRYLLSTEPVHIAMYQGPEQEMMQPRRPPPRPGRPTTGL
jgi:hypothetical protein